MPTPGHTRGHQAVVIETSNGATVIAGHVPYDADEFQHVTSTGKLPERHGGGTDPEDDLASAQRLIELEPRRVFFTHSEAFWDGGSR